MVFIGARQHALAVMAHDGAHSLLLRNRRWNDLLAQFVLAWPLLMAFGAYRKVHVRHHRHLNTSEDPDWARNRPDRLATHPGRWEFLRILLGLSGDQRALLDVMRARQADEPSAPLEWMRWPWTLALVLGFVLAGRLDALLLYWFVPLFTWFLVTMRLKGTAEHFAVETGPRGHGSRTVIASLPERWLVAPRNVAYHAEHHLYPGVPCYRLPALHRRLMEQPAYREQVHLTRGYAAYLGECLELSRRPAAPAGTP